jgi:hypothetical protein
VNLLFLKSISALFRGATIYHSIYNWKILLSDYTPLYAYGLGALDTSILFVELKKLSYINPKAHVFGNDLGFSRKIREGLPNTGFLKKNTIK